MSRLYYDNANPGTARTYGYIYLANNTRKEDGNAKTYIYNWGVRLELFKGTQTLPPDSKCEGRGNLKPGQHTNLPELCCTLRPDNNNAPRGGWYTVQANYWINVSDGDGPEDPCALQLSFGFWHNPKPE